ncbi:MAG: Intein-containing protein [Candidatus Collierbacteria bacterium GW2011_GWB1_44_6]|uniref:Intein-containing protein n=1 Tax=Candidatus Collierbacteria bacterium GW2011_GWB1_44_6 TaxID=1618384 RepID=A0A0G1LRP9_9BACT|nr:MAG: Intein-containing protein [Candidatus Collierbacteria bacterium GW2011_GWB1_44_6]
MPKLNHDLAYAVGLICTDGYLSKDGRHIIFTSVDKDLIEIFKKCLNKTNPITVNPKSSLSKQICYKVQIGDVQLYKWLLHTGLFPKKSLTLERINIGTRYFRDFLRGHLDGDGSIIKYEDRYLQHLNPKYVYKRLFVYFNSASQKHIYWLQTTITKLTKLKGSISSYQSKTRVGTNPYYTLKFSTKEATILLNWIYYDPEVPCLKRKYDKAKSYLI